MKEYEINSRVISWLNILSIVLSIIGYIILISVNWKIAIAIFIIQWSINIYNYIRYDKSAIL
jgi:hypothetical protein